MAGRYQFCPDCNKETETVVDSITTERVCTECGLVVDTNTIDETQDVRIFDDNHDAQRIERAAPEGGLSAIHVKGRGAGSLVSAARKILKSSKEDNTKQHREAMGELGMRLSVTQPVVERALYIFEKFCSSKEAPFRGKDKKKIDSIVVSCLYNAGKQLNQQKPLEEWAQATDLTLKDIFQAGKTIQPFLHADNANYLSNPEPLRVEGSKNGRSGVRDHSKFWDPDSLHYSSQGLKSFVSRLCRLVGFEFSERIIAEEMATEVVKSVNMRRKPASIAGVIVWICALLHGREVDLKLLSKNSVSVKVLRETYLDLYPHLKTLVPTGKFGEFKQCVTKLRAP